MRAIAVLLTGLVLVQTTAPGAAEQARSRIRGSEEPERIPDWKAWEGLFAFLSSITNGKTDPKDPEVSGFVRGNLFISSEDAGVLLRITARVRARLEELWDQEDHDLETELGLPHDGTDRSQLRLRQEKQLVLEARDEILATVTPRGAKALLRYVAANVKPGMVVGVEVPE